MIHCDVSPEEAWAWNESRPDEKYTKDVFDGLVARYETPNGTNRYFYTDSDWFFKSTISNFEKIGGILLFSYLCHQDLSTASHFLLAFLIGHRLLRTSQPSASLCLQQAFYMNLIRLVQGFGFFLIRFTFIGKFSCRPHPKSSLLL